MRLAMVAMFAASGCLILEPPPPPCADEACPDGQLCNELDECEDACFDEDCSGGNVCWDLFSDCRSDCIEDSDCKPGWSCCTGLRCGDDDFTCVRDR